MTETRTSETVAEGQGWRQALGWDASGAEATRGGLRRLAKVAATRLQPHQYLRYQPVVRHLQRRLDSGGDASVIEIGSGSLGVTRFWPHPVTGVDLGFAGPCLGHLERITCSALELPFPDRSFASAVSVDVLEHIPAAERGLALKEMLRVAREDVLFGVPCGAVARATDSWGEQRCRDVLAGPLSASRRASIVRRSSFLSEHVEAGYPEAEEMRMAIDLAARELGREVRVTEFENESASAWRFMFPAVVPLTRFGRPLRLLAGLLALPLLMRSRAGGFYRRFFMIEFVDGKPGSRQ